MTAKKTTPAAPAAVDAKAVIKTRVKARDAALLALSRAHADEFRELLVSEFLARGLEYKGRPRLTDEQREARKAAEAERAAKALARAQARVKAAKVS